MPAAVRQLLEKGVNPDVTNEGSLTALHRVSLRCWKMDGFVFRSGEDCTRRLVTAVYVCTIRGRAAPAGLLVDFVISSYLL